MATVLVRRSSATLATVYTHFIMLVILCVFNFTILANALPVNAGYGFALIVLSSVAAILGITAQDPDETLLRSFLLCVSVLWTSVGVYHVVETFRPTGTTDSQALWAGFSAFLLVSLFFVLGSLHHRSKFTAVLSLGYFLASIFEICSLWRPLRTSVGAYYLLMAALALYYVFSVVLRKFRQGEMSAQAAAVVSRGLISRDYVPLGHAMNTVAFAIFAGQVTGVYQSAAQGFAWVLTAGCYQLLAAVVAVRRSDSYNGFYFFLHSMFWVAIGFNLCVEYVTGIAGPPLMAVTVIFFITFFVVGVASLFREIYQCLQNIALCVLVVAIHVDGTRGPFIGAMGWILLVISLYGLAAHISRAKDSSFKLPLGMRCLEGARLKRIIENSSTCCVRCLYGKLGSAAVGKDTSATARQRALFSEDFILGYSKYLDLDVVGFASNAIALASILWIPQGPWVLPWALAFGGLTQYIVGSVSFARGLTFESCSFFIFGSLWMIWGPARGLGALSLDHGPAVVAGHVGFLVVGLLQLALSLTISKVWSLLLFLYMLVVVGFLLNALAVPAFFVYEIVIGILFVLVCLYGFLSTALKAAVGRDVLPFGKPFLQVSYLHSQGSRALWADARRATGVKTIADIMNRGGICGIPTDVVYVLVAAVKFPDAVKRAYNTKKDAEDRPMSMWISRTEQLQDGRPLFGELVWAFMNEIWPSTVSCVIPKGEWLDNLGIGEANALVGRPDSIAVRMPDNCVTSYLVDQTGPIAVTSANPTGEADTTHHLQVLAKLGLDNVDGILCAGPSPENMASTVVDTRRMGQGQLSFFRIGVVPRAHVEHVFEYVRARFDNQGPTIPPSVLATDLSGGMVNKAFVMNEESNNSGDNNHGNDSGSDSGVSGGNGGSQTDDETPLEPNSQTISGHENPIYDNTDESYGGSVFSSSSSGRARSSSPEGNRQSPSRSDEGRPPSPLSETASSGSGNGAYESMVVSPSGAMQLQHSRDIAGQRRLSGSQSPQAHFRMNPLFQDTNIS